jgi:hypothetical protein
VACSQSLLRLPEHRAIRRLGRPRLRLAGRHRITGGRPLGTAKEFIDYCLSASEQALFHRAGYSEIKPNTQ